MRLPDEMEIATCSYREFTPDMGVGVATSVGMRGVRVETVPARSLKPFRLIKQKELSRDEWKEAYLKELEFAQERIASELENIWSENGQKRLVLLCYEDLSKDVPCHRRYVAEWINDKTGKDVPELGRTKDDTLEGVTDEHRGTAEDG